MFEVLLYCKVHAALKCQKHTRCILEHLVHQLLYLEDRVLVDQEVEEGVEIVE